MDETSAPVSFYEWLKRRRKALDLTQDELAQRVGCSTGALRKIEAGERRPSKQLAELIAKELEIPDQDLATFIRVARGELNIERLQRPDLDILRSLAGISSIPQPHPEIMLEAEPKTSQPASRIPVQTTTLVGRDAELKALEKLFNDPQCRLLTLTGIGGIGKTRLAIEFATENASRFPGGIFFIPLTPVNSPEKIVPAIADVLGYGFSGPGEPKEQLLNYISGAVRPEALFIFDNLEHLLIQKPVTEDKTGVVDLIAEILQRLPNFKVLGTSRERLNLHGEWIYELHGLSVPAREFLGELEDYDAVALFIKSARRGKVDFRAAGDEETALVQICQLVEGVPLAIELAAAWVSILSCQEIAQEIQANMDFLTSSMRDMPERHRSIRATFDHSWKLLSEAERRALCQLSVFHGGFDRNAALQVAGASLALLASLMDKSLVRRTETGRYDLHEVIRQYGLAHLDDYPDCLKTYERHCSYYLSFVQARETFLKSSAQQETIRQLMDEIDNIRAAWAWAIDQRRYDQLGQAGRGFGWYYEITGMYREGIEQFELLIQVLKTEPQDHEFCWILGLAFVQQGLLYFRTGEFDHALQLYLESISILDSLDHNSLLTDALIFSGTIQHLNGEYAEARKLLDRGLVTARENNDRWFEAYGIYNLGYFASLMGHFDEGYEQMLSGLAIWRTLGDPHSIALGLNFIIPTMNQLALYEEAKAFTHESIRICEQTKNLWGLGTAYRYLGLTALAEGQPSEAQLHFRKSLDIFGEYFVGWDIARTLTYLGDAVLMAGDYPGAQQNYRDGLRVAIEAKSVPVALDALVGLSEVHARSGKQDNALMLCYTVLDHPASEAESKLRAQRLSAELELVLDPGQAAAARTIAQQKSFEAIVNENLA